MMTKEKHIEWLLELQEHPEQLTDELQQILTDDEMCQLVKQLGFAKRAFKHDELTNDIPDVDAEWEKFAACHEEELEVLDEREWRRVGDGTSGVRKPRFTLHIPSHKIAASFIGVLLASSIAFAAIQIVRNINMPKPQLPATEQTAKIKPVTSLTHDTIKTDTTATITTISTEPYIFNNTSLDSILTAIAAVHGVSVEFENDEARQLRFHFVWKREDSLAHVVEKLNTFEAVNIGVEDKTLVVR